MNLRITALETEIEGLSTREKLLSEARENDIQAFEARQIRDKNAIAALEEIIPSLQNLISNGGGVFLEKSKDEISKILKKIPGSKPL